MAEFLINGRRYEVDADGFLQAPELWSEEVAKDFARMKNVDHMTQEHWKLIRYIRYYYEQYGIAPMERKLSRETGFSPDKIVPAVPIGSGQGRLQGGGISRLICAR